jgi:phosphomannomutase
MRELKIGTSAVRGIVGEGFTPELVVDFASAFGTWVEGKPVVIGHDSRRSTPMFKSAAVAGLLSPGCEIIDLGLCPTPLVSFGVREMGCGGGISITGSHNDSRWNALKFVGPDGALLNPVKSEELFDIYHASAFRTAHRDLLPPVGPAPEILDRYLEHLLAHLDIEAIRQSGFGVAVDFCNGACYSAAKRFLAELGCKLFPLNPDPKGVFAHPPAPSAAHMEELSLFVQNLDVSLGVALNIDGDRVAFTTEKGTPVSAESTLPLAAINRLNRRPGPIVTNVCTSQTVDAIANQFDQPVLRTGVGESLVIDRGFEEGAAVVGEGSGGVAALPITPTFDGLLTLGMVLETMAETQSSLSKLAEDLPRFFIGKGEIKCSPVQAYGTLEELRKEFSGLPHDDSDGIRVDWTEAWMHVRASKTEPLLRVTVEAEDEERAYLLFQETMSRVRQLVKASRGI